MIEHNPELPLVKRILAAIRAFLYRHGLLKNLTPDDIKALAVASARRATRQAQSARVALRPSYEQAPLWYSEMAKFIEDKGQGKAKAADWVKLLDGWAKQGKFKGDELEWSGVKEWLGMQEKLGLEWVPAGSGFQTGPVTKDHVLRFLRENGVQVEETVLGGDAIEPRISVIDTQDVVPFIDLEADDIFVPDPETRETEYTYEDESTGEQFTVRGSDFAGHWWVTHEETTNVGTNA